MASASDPDDLRTRYRRTKGAPVTTGDHVPDGKVTAFWSSRALDGDHSIAGGDHILLNGEEDLSDLPNRPLPCGGDPVGLERKGPSPVGRLPADCLRAAPSGLRAGLEAAFCPREDGQFVLVLLDEIAERKHHAWLVGGSVRDLLSPGSAGPVKDFDLAGTIGPYCLDQAMSRLLRRSGRGNYIRRLSSQNILSVAPPGEDSPRLVEYKPLARPGHRPRVWGGGLREDATTRDLTFNALYYDWQLDVLADPCGEGQADLDSRVMRTPYEGTDVVELARILLRCVKFQLRYLDFDVSPMVKIFEENLPADLDTISKCDWNQLAGMYQRTIPPELAGRDRADEMAVVAEFGPKATRLLQVIKAKAGNEERAEA
jgi:hypothetical protein